MTVVFCRGVPASVERRSWKGTQPAGTAQGSSIEKSACRTTRGPLSICDSDDRGEPATAHRMQRPQCWERIVDFEFDELKREFLTEAEEKVVEMQAKLDERSPQSLERLTYLAHPLKASGGSYGFERISTDAAELERAVELLVNGGQDDRLEEQIQQHVVNLRAEIERRSRELAVSAR